MIMMLMTLDCMWLSYIVNIMTANDLETKGARAAAVVILIKISPTYVYVFIYFPNNLLWAPIQYKDVILPV